MQIEPLKKSDIQLYKALIDECFGGSNDQSFYEQYNPNAEYQIIVAKDNDKIIGSITFYKINLFTFSFQPALEIFNVAVLPDYRRQKIAQQIFDYIISYAKNNNYKSIYLTCLDTAFPAHKLYESIGFIRVGSVKYSLSIK